MNMDFILYCAMCWGVYQAMTEEEKQELLDWENENLDGCTIGTADWPGWIPIAGPPPKPPPRKEKIKKKPTPRSLRIRAFERDRYRCLYCGTWKELTVDHMIPESRGGRTVLENLQTLCKSCNSRKGSK